MKKCNFVEIKKENDLITIIYHCINCEAVSIIKTKQLYTSVGDLITVFDGLLTETIINNDKTIEIKTKL